MRTKASTATRGCWRPSRPPSFCMDPLYRANAHSGLGLCYRAPMGLKDLFSAEGRAARSLQKHVNRAKNADSQHVDRQASLDILRDAAHDGNEDAIAGLLGRFTIRY